MSKEKNSVLYPGLLFIGKSDELGLSCRGLLFVKENLYLNNLVPNKISFSATIFQRGLVLPFLLSPFIQLIDQHCTKLKAFEPQLMGSA
jgi:hypothetical protein